MQIYLPCHTTSTSFHNVSTLGDSPPDYLVDYLTSTAVFNFNSLDAIRLAQFALPLSMTRGFEPTPHKHATFPIRLASSKYPSGETFS